MMRRALVAVRIGDDARHQPVNSHRGDRVMDSWRIIVIAATLAPLLAECSQPEGPAAEHGLCYTQTQCAGGNTSGLPTKDQCKAAGGKSWLGGAANYCVPIM
jgi:hypothetical protein